VLQASILAEADIVFATLSSAGGPVFDAGCPPRHFDLVLVDEAAQATEPAVLQALLHGGRHLVLVGPGPGPAAADHHLAGCRGGPVALSV
jgi:senataxin